MDEKCTYRTNWSDVISKNSTIRQYFDWAITSAAFPVLHPVVWQQEVHDRVVTPKFFDLQP